MANNSYTLEQEWNPTGNPNLQRDLLVFTRDLRGKQPTAQQLQKLDPSVRQAYLNSNPVAASNFGWMDQNYLVQNLSGGAGYQSPSTTGYDKRGRPIAPEFQYAGKTGDAGIQLAGTPQYNLQSQIDTRFLDKMRTEGLRDPGTQSVWRQLMGNKLISDAASQMSQVQKQNQMNMNTAAMRGGFGRGAMERMGQRANLNALQASQGVMRQKYGLDVQDETNRLGQLQNLGQAESAVGAAKTGVEEFNIRNRLNELMQQRAMDVNKYNERMRAWAAERTAAATPSSGGGKK